MRIPKKFKIFGYTFKVEEVNDLRHTDCTDGQFLSSPGIIQLQKPVEGAPYDSAKLEQVFLHELMHAIFWSLNRKELLRDEELVDQIAACLQQVFATSEYETLGGKPFEQNVIINHVNAEAINAAIDKNPGIIANIMRKYPSFIPGMVSKSVFTADSLYRNEAEKQDRAERKAFEKKRKKKKAQKPIVYGKKSKR